MVLRRHPTGNLIEDPQLLEYIAVGDDRGLRRDLFSPRCGGIANLLERGGGGRRRRECRHPAAEGLWPPDRIPLLLEVPINDSLEVAVELGPERPA